jgi:hypothetical protein
VKSLVRSFDKKRPQTQARSVAPFQSEVKIMRFKFAICFVMLAFLPRVGQARWDEGVLNDLLTRLPSRADLVCVLDLEEASREVTALFEHMLATEVMQATAESRNLVGFLRRQMKLGMAAQGRFFGFDVYSDIKTSAFGMVVNQNGSLDWVLAVRGRFLKGMQGPAFGHKQAVHISGQSITSPQQGIQATILHGNVLVVATTKVMPAALLGNDTEEMLARHGGLNALGSAGRLVGISVAPDALSKEKLPWLNLFQGLLSTTKALRLDMGEGLTITLQGQGETVHEKGRMFMSGLRELLMAWAYLWRANGLVVLGLDLGSVEAFPGGLKVVFSHRAALQKAIDEFFPPVVATPHLTETGSTIILHVEVDAVTRATLMLGVVSIFSSMMGRAG